MSAETSIGGRFVWQEREERGQEVWSCHAIEASVEIWPRPQYCDRGRWQAFVMDAGFPTNPNPFEAADAFPRYYFSLDRAKAEMEDLFSFRGYTPRP